MLWLLNLSALMLMSAAPVLMVFFAFKAKTQSRSAYCLAAGLLGSAGAIVAIALAGMTHDETPA
jgi:hypothetical protein